MKEQSEKAVMKKYIDSLYNEREKVRSLIIRLEGYLNIVSQDGEKTDKMLSKCIGIIFDSFRQIETGYKQFRGKK